MSLIILLLYGISLAIFLLALLWILVPAFYGLPSKPTALNRIRKALQLVNLKEGEVLYDLGAGDGRVLLIAAKEFGAKTIGIEVGPIQCAVIWLRITANGLSDRIKIRWGNFFKTNLKDADVVFVYATWREVVKLAPYLKAQMRPGSRVVSISADFLEWEPTSFDDHGLIFVYEMPPKVGNLTTYMLKNS